MDNMSALMSQRSNSSALTLGDKADTSSSNQHHVQRGNRSHGSRASVEKISERNGDELLVHFGTRTKKTIILEDGRRMLRGWLIHESNLRVRSRRRGYQVMDKWRTGLMAPKVRVEENRWGQFLEEWIGRWNPLTGRNKSLMGPHLTLGGIGKVNGGILFGKNKSFGKKNRGSSQDSIRIRANRCLDSSKGPRIGRTLAGRA